MVKKKSNDEQKDKYRLDLTPHERVEEDLQRKIAPEKKTEIRDLIDNKYSALEQILNQNMGSMPITVVEKDSVVRNEDWTSNNGSEIYKTAAYQTINPVSVEVSSPRII